MSVFEDILIDLRDCIQNSNEFKDIDVYFDDSDGICDWCGCLGYSLRPTL